MTITRIHLHDVVLDLTARADGALRLRSDRASESPVVIELPEGKWQTQCPGAVIQGRRLTLPLPAGTTEISPAN